MGFETINEKLFGVRTLDRRYIDIRAKLYVKRLLCKIRLLKKPDRNLNFRTPGSNASHYDKGIWHSTFEKHLGRERMFLDPLTLLRVGVRDIKAASGAINARLGLKVMGACYEGFSQTLKCTYGSHHAVLFYNISKYIFYMTDPFLNVIDVERLLTPQWRQYIHAEWMSKLRKT